MENLSIKRTGNSVEMFNHSLSHEIYRKRQEDRESVEFCEQALDRLRRILPLPDSAVMISPTNIRLPGHIMEGKRFREKSTGRVYVSEKVCFQFYGGWVYGILLNCGGSHTFLYYQNYSCMNEIIQEGVEEFWQRFELEGSGS